MILLIGLIIAAGGLYLTTEKATILVNPQVWSQYSPYGTSYEFKVNDEVLKPGAGLEYGFLSHIDRVVVTDTKDAQFELKRDYNINEYSGEVTRRFVLYGPEDAELPATGRYRFDFIKDDVIVLTKHVDYTQSNLGYPTDVTWERRGSDIFVQWTPPANVDKQNWYKVLIGNNYGTPEAFASLRFDGDASSGLLEDVPFVENGEYQINVAVFSNEGFAYSEFQFFKWDETASQIEVN